jgi:predicted transcriptional regulator
MSNADLTSDLLLLGLSPHDAAVYLSLLACGTSPVGPLIADSQLHRNIVYTSLQHLRARKLVAESKRKGKKCFSIADPAVFLEEADRKRTSAKHLVRAIQDRLQQVPQDITIHSGNEEYLSLLSGILRGMPTKSTVYVLGTGGEAFMETTMRPIWAEYHEVAQEQELYIRMIGYASQRESIQGDITGLRYYSMRYLPDSVENPAGVHIYPELSLVLNIIYSDKNTPVTAIRIRNESLTKGYLNLFNNLWKSGKE